MAIPKPLQSIRFRLSLAFSIVVFSVGSFLTAGIYIYQVNQLAEPVLQGEPIFVTNPDTGLPEETSLQLVFPEVAQQFVIQQVEQQAYRRALNELRVATLASMGVLFAISFLAGWVFAGWTLKPMERIGEVVRDITANDLTRRISMSGPDDELKALADTFDSTLDRLQGAFEDQRRFAHEASHELRNPLAVARTNLELALGGGDKGEVVEAANVALRATERMSTLIEELLEQARQGVPELHHGLVDLSKMVTELAGEFQAAAEQRGLTIEVSSGNQTAKELEQVTLRGDGPALRRAVANLLSNAVRLAPVGSVINLDLRVDSAQAVLSVTDQGPGIAAEDQARVFERFWRGTDPGAGSGLGLSIVRRVAERHGGSISLRSAVAASGEFFADSQEFDRTLAGSVFTVRLPMTMDNRRDGLTQVLAADA